MRADIEGCYPGVLKDSERAQVLTKLNEVRARHGLLAVDYDASGDVAAMDAALYMVANETLTHSPSASGKCYTAGAHQAASTSNLYYAWYGGVINVDGVASSSAVNAYLVDWNVPSLGHRRWILDPFLARTSFGRVDGKPTASSSRYYTASTLQVIGNARSNVSAMTNDYVAYPQGNYPASEFRTDWFMSFTAIASKINRNANGSGQVSYGAATITVTPDGGAPLAISEVIADYAGYGLSNSLQWKAAGLQSGVNYTVMIANVTVNGSARNYSYSFRLQ